MSANLHKKEKSPSLTSFPSSTSPRLSSGDELRLPAILPVAGPIAGVLVHFLHTFEAGSGLMDCKRSALFVLCIVSLFCTSPALFYGTQRRPQSIVDYWWDYNWTLILVQVWEIHYKNDGFGG